MKRAPAHISAIYPHLCLRLLLAVFLLTAGLSVASAASDDDSGYDEVAINLTVPRVGSVEITAIIHAEEAYLPLKDVFDFLKIKADVYGNFDTLQGYMITAAAPFLLDRINNKLTYKGKTTQIAAGDIIHTEINLYLRAATIKQLFELDCAFNFRSLSIELTSKLELPAIKEMQQAQMRKNISSLKAERKADTIIGKHFIPFSIGTADWNINTAQDSYTKESNTRLSLGLGGVIAGGEVSALLNYNSSPRTMLQNNQQYYRWRYVNNQNPLIKQVIAGRVVTQSMATLNSPVTGVQLTNTPTTYRKAYGTYTISNTTQPGWTVELYVNNVLINYTMADASGFYTFEVPLVYGTTSVLLRFYSQWGEEQVAQQVLTIPFNFMALHQFEYNLTAGMVSDANKSAFTRLNMSYGLSSHITVGGGAEYLSGPTRPHFMPFVNTAIRLRSNVLVSGEHTLNVRTKAALNYRTLRNTQFDLTYVRFNREQTAIFSNTVEEIKAIWAMPVKGKTVHGFSRLTFHQATFLTPKNAAAKKRTAAEYLFSATYKGVNANLNTTTVFMTDQQAEVISNLSMNMRLPGRIRLTPQVQYEFGKKNFSTIKLEVERSVFTRGFVNLAFEENRVTGFKSITAGLRYNFLWGQASTNVVQTAKGISAMQSARGSIIYDNHTGYATASAQSSVGRGGIIVYAFIDVNGNGIQDNNEPRTTGLNLKVSGGRIQKSTKDTSVVISGLEAFNNYYLEFDNSSFDNIAWRIKKPVVSVAIEPNYFRRIAIPVSVLSEVSGYVYRNKTGLARMVVNIYNNNNALVGRVLSETDGYFSFLGLVPGKYEAKIDGNQMNKLGFTASQPLSFTVPETVEGIVVDGLEFNIEK